MGEPISNLVVFAAVDGGLLSVDRLRYQWGAPRPLNGAPSLSPGQFPAIVQRPKVPDDFDVFVPLAERGVEHHVFHRPASAWESLGIIDRELPHVDAIAAVVGDDGRYDVVMRSETALQHISCEAGARSWSPQCTIVAGAVVTARGADGAVHSASPA